MENSSFFYVMIFYSLQLIFIVLKELQAEIFGRTFGCCILSDKLFRLFEKQIYYLETKQNTPFHSVFT